jgi:hypothetical protein
MSQQQRQQQQQQRPFLTQLSRRDALRLAVGGVAGMLVADCFHLPLLAASATTRPAAAPPAKAVIQIWMWGGPCHIDTFDPKPDAGSDYTGPLNHAIETNVSGIRIGELLPLLAKQANRYSLIRSMTHGVNAHETASYMVQTGHAPGGHEVYPGAGAVVSLFKGYDAGYKGLIPPYVVLTDLQGRFSECGFLGNKYKPFATGGDPAAPRFAVEGVVAPGISESRQRGRRELLHELDALGHALKDDRRLEAFRKSEDEAYELILGDAGKVFGLSQENDDLRERYGRSTFGQSCLVARRLVERGVPYVTINYKGWDTHKQHFQTMRRQLPDLDKGLSALLQDLADRGLLDSTIVWCSGEFGRTPRVLWEAPWNGGRGHYGKCFSALVAGGGFRGGQVVGASDQTGEEVRDRPVRPVDLLASMYQRLGIDLRAKLPHPQGLDVRVADIADQAPGAAGLLREIM